MPRKEMMACCTAHRMKGVGILVIGVLILANVYWPFMNWGVFAGALFILAGIAKLTIPHKYH